MDQSEIMPDSEIGPQSEYGAGFGVVEPIGVEAGNDDGPELADGGRTAAASEAGTRIGRVLVVSGSQIVVLIDNSVADDGSAAASTMQIGSLVKMRTPDSTVFAMINGLSIPVPEPGNADEEIRIAELEVLGEALTGADGGHEPFQRGVSVFPALGDGVYSSTQEDLAKVYAAPAVSTVRVGTIHQDRSVPAFITTDELLGKHFAVLGTTGCGKSCAVALILRAILSQHRNGHVLLLDPHNEYARAFGDAAEVLDPGSLQLPYWLLNFEELVEVLVDRASETREAEVAILKDAVLVAKQRYRGEGENDKRLTVDTPVPFRLKDLLQIVDDAVGKLDRPDSSAPYLRIKRRFDALKSDPRYAFMFPGLVVRDNMAAILSTLFRVPVAGKPITIVDLSGVPSEVLNVVVSVLCRMTFDFALLCDRAVPILLVCEEAHRYAPQNAELGFEPTKKALSRIAKEGRKYGVSLCVVSQRPSEIAAGILSQCNTIFALRLSNQADQDYVRGTIKESAVGLLESLPSLRNAEAIVVGEGVPVPLRMCLDELPEDQQPLSGTASFSTAWHADCEDANFLTEIVERWRGLR